MIVVHSIELTECTKGKIAVSLNVAVGQIIGNHNSDFHNTSQGPVDFIQLELLQNFLIGRL